MQQVFDKPAIRRFRARAGKLAIPGSQFLLESIGGDIADRLALVDRRFSRAAITSGNAVHLDPDFLAGTRHAGLAFDRPPDWEQSDEDRLTGFEPELDLALSLLSLHETDDTVGALVQIRRLLRPDGLFLGVMPGAGTLQELREALLEAEMELAGGASPRVYPFADVRAAGALLQRAGFALPVTDAETITVRYDDMFALMRDLRHMGAANGLLARARKPSPRRLFLRAAQIYAQRFGDPDGRIPATFSMIFLSAWAPAQTQQQPARRGSATASLAEALQQIDNKKGRD